MEVVLCIKTLVSDIQVPYDIILFGRKFVCTKCIVLALFSHLKLQP